jgi:hypothetical protein
VLVLGLAVTLASLPASARAEALTPIVVSISGATCPDRPVLDEALARRGLGSAASGARFRLQLVGAGASLDLTLRDDDGEVLLARTLDTEECSALAETIAMLVERRLQGIAWRATLVAPPELPPAAAPSPPAPPEPPPDSARPRRPPAPAAHAARAVETSRPWAIDLQLGALFATGFAEIGGAPGPRGGVRLRPDAPVALQVGLGWLVHDGVAIPGGGQARVERLPIAIFAGGSLRRRGVELDLGARAELELLLAESRGVTRPDRSRQVALRVGPAATLGVVLVGPVWAGVDAAALAVLRGWDFVIERGDEPGARTRVASQVLALEAGAFLAVRLPAL